VRARPIGILYMSDEAGQDSKLLAVPHKKLSALYEDIQEPADLPQLLIKQIEHFFENYKDLEPGKWVKVDKWGGAADALAEVTKAREAYLKDKG
jgi:inorganic pyrophosphatase